MGQLLFIGLGLWDERDMSLRGLEEASHCQVLFAEFYTSRLVGTSPEGLQRVLRKPFTVLTREQVEDGRLVLAAARGSMVGFLTPGDPMAATTHVDLRLRAERMGIPTRIIHGASILTAAAGLLGLQIYKFGRTTSVPFPSPGFRPISPYEAVATNRAAGLHTLVLLDLQGDRFLAARDALEYLLGVEAEEKRGIITEATLTCILGQVGSPNPSVAVGPLGGVSGRDLGGPPQCIVFPGQLHFLEEEMLAMLATPRP